MFGLAVVVLSLALLLGAILVPDVGEVELLKRLLYANSGAEAGTLRLFKNNLTPAESDTAATFTPADFTGAAPLTLTSTQAAGTWAVPTTASRRPAGRGWLRCRCSAPAPAVPQPTAKV